MAEPGGDHMHRHASQQQGRGVDVPQIMQPGMRQRLALLVIVGVDERGHERRHRIGVDRLAPGGGEHVVVGAAPLGTYSQPFSGLALAVISEYLHGFGVDADGAGPAALGCSLDALAPR